MPDRRVTDLERAAARHWQAPEQEQLGDWLLRAAAGFTGRANSALPLGDPGLRPMIVLPRVRRPSRWKTYWPNGPGFPAPARPSS